MNKYEMRARAREVGAIGIFYDVVDVTNAHSIEDARQQFSERWDYFLLPVITLLPKDE